MKVKCITDNHLFFTKGQCYDVESQGQNPYVLQGKPYYKLEDNTGMKAFVPRRDFIELPTSEIEDTVSNSDNKNNSIIRKVDRYTGLNNHNMVIDDMVESIVDGIKKEKDINMFLSCPAMHDVIERFNNEIERIAKDNGWETVKLKSVKCNNGTQITLTLDID